MKKTLLAASLAALGTVANAQPGYLTHPETGVVMSPYGLCWRSSAWTPEQSVSPCDAVPQAAAPIAPPPPVVLEQPAPAPAPAPIVRAPDPEPKVAPAPAPVVARPVVPEKVTLSADLLFAFNSATLRDAGKEKLDQLAARLRGTSVDEIKIVGHADRIGSTAYNQRISEERAAAVRDHLQKTAAVQNIRTAGMGKSQPVTGDACKAVQLKARLIDCLQPDRRVDIEIFGTRTASAEPGSSGSGASAVRVKAD
jgi:OOP family OmpA-OmpF porin